jgi:alpha 1,3-glucosidase
LYVDDGHSFNYRSGEYTFVQFSFSDSVLQNKVEHSSNINGNIERIVVLGLSNKVKKIVNTSTGASIQWVEGENNAIILRKPQLSILENWSLSFQF